LLRASPCVIMYGFLHLKRLFGWAKYYFELDDKSCSLTYSLDPVSEQVGAFDLAKFMITKTDQSSGRCFRLVSKSKEYVLKADSASICNDWVLAIGRAQIKLPFTRRDSRVEFDPEIKVKEYARPEADAKEHVDAQKISPVQLAVFMMNLRYASEDDDTLDPNIRALLHKLAKARKRMDSANAATDSSKQPDVQTSTGSKKQLRVQSSKAVENVC